MLKIGVIPFQIIKKRPSILFVSSLKRGRWVLPKGNLKKGESRKKGCLREAFEEAGVKGKILKHFPMTFIMQSSDHPNGQTPVVYYPMLVQNIAEQWPEDDQRKRQWMPLDDAMSDIKSRDIHRVIRHFEKLYPWIMNRE